MRDYRVLSMDYIGGPVTIHDVALDLDDVPWAKRQFWAPDAAEKDGKYYLYFPTKDKQDIFKIGRLYYRCRVWQSLLCGHIEHMEIWGLGV